MRRRFWTKTVKTILFWAAVLAVVITLGAALRQGRSEGAGQNIVSSLLAPLRSGVRALDRQAERFYDYIYRYEKLEAENEALRKQLAENEQAVAEAEAYRRENRRLLELMEFQEENSQLTFVPAKVVAWDTSVWESRISINKGTAHGITEGMCAITSTGQVVGLVTECGLNWATISTIYDVSVQISSLVEGTGYSGVAQAHRDTVGKEELQLRHVTGTAKLQNGQRVVTAGSERYPAGLLLGTVAASGLDETGLSRYAVLDTQGVLDDLEQVFLVTEILPQA